MGKPGGREIERTAAALIAAAIDGGAAAAAALITGPGVHPALAAEVAISLADGIALIVRTCEGDPGEFRAEIGEQLRMLAAADAGG